MGTAVRTPRQARVKEVEKVFLSNREAQKYLGVSDSTLKGWRLGGRLPYYKVGSVVWYEKSDIDRLVRGGRQ